MSKFGWKKPTGPFKKLFFVHFGPENCFFLCYALKTHFFDFRQTQLNGIISSSYPEVTLDTFGFPVGGRLAARRAVFWPRLPKMALFVANNACRLQRSCWSTLVIENGWNGMEQVTGHPGWSFVPVGSARVFPILVQEPPKRAKMVQKWPKMA